MTLRPTRDPPAAPHMTFSSDFTLGVEEELLLVDPATLALAPLSSRIVPAVRVPEDGGKVMHDVYEACVETASPISDHAVDGVASLRATSSRCRCPCRATWPRSTA